MNLSMEQKYEAIIKSQSGILYIQGKPGEAKTAIAEAIAKKNDWQFIDIRLAQVDSAEVIGIPVRDELDGQVVHTYALPEWAIKANKKPTLVFFDELNRAVLETRNAALQILNERKIGWNFKFNDAVYFMSAGNLGEEDGTEVEELDAALRNRLVMVSHVLEFKDWKTWAESAKINPWIIRFLEANPAAIHDADGAKNDRAYASYRSWTNFAKFLDSVIPDSTSIPEIISYATEVGASYVGKHILKFTRYMEDQKNVSLKDVMKNYDKVKDFLDVNNQARMYELMADLEKLDFESIKEKELENLFKFFEECVHEDKLTAFAANLFDACFSDGKHLQIPTGGGKPQLVNVDNFKAFMKRFPSIHKGLDLRKTRRGEQEIYS